MDDDLLNIYNTIYFMNYDELIVTTKTNTI